MMYNPAEENDSDEIYYQKYLRYKAKYLNLKQTGGVTLKDGVYCFFTSDVQATNLADAFNPENYGKTRKAPSYEEIKKILNKKAYMIKDMDKDLSLVKGKEEKKGKNMPDQPGAPLDLVESLKFNRYFNRCDTTHQGDIKTLISNNNIQNNTSMFTPTKMVTIEINKVLQNRLINTSSI